MNYIKQIIYGNKLQKLIELGMEQLDEGNYMSAITFFTHALNIDNTCEEALFLRGKSFYQVNSYENAKADFNQLEESSPAYNSEVYYLLARIKLSNNNTAKAVYYANKYLELNTDNIQVQYFTARTKYLNKDYDEALDLVDLLILSIDDNFALRYFRSLILFAQENFISALIDIDKAITFNPLKEFAFNLRALINIQLFNYSDAVGDLNNSIKLCPTNALYYFNRAKIQLKIGDLLSAKNSINRAIELDPLNKTFYLLKGELNLLTENNIEAIDSYTSAYKQDEKDLELLNQISRLKMCFGDFKGAKLDLNKIKDIKSEKFDDYYYGAFLDYQLDDKEDSKESLQKLVNSSPENKDAILQIGIIEFSLHNYQKAFDTFKLINSEDANFKKAFIFKLQALIKLGRTHDALLELNSISYDDQNDYLILASQINFLNKNYGSSEQYLNKYLENNLHNSATKVLLNLIRVNQGKLNETEELNEFELEEFIKEEGQILNGIINFEKDQYFSAKYRLSNINDLSKNKGESLRPLILYAEKQIS